MVYKVDEDGYAVLDANTVVGPQGLSIARGLVAFDGISLRRALCEPTDPQGLYIELSNSETLIREFLQEQRTTKTRFTELVDGIAFLTSLKGLNGVIASLEGQLQGAVKTTLLRSAQRTEQLSLVGSLPDHALRGLLREESAYLFQVVRKDKLQMMLEFRVDSVDYIANTTAGAVYRVDLLPMHAYDTYQSLRLSLLSQYIRIKRQSSEEKGEHYPLLLTSKPVVRSEPMHLLQR